ncbi:MAG: flagellar export chaperone FlgN [Planctomycetes bacterium]|nr:flagellar export chaperone FlgN [Planctomycetota bacterium]
MSPAPLDFEAFIRDCAAQRTLYADMLELARRQDALIGSGDLDGLLELVAKKQSLLHRVSSLDARSAAFRAVWKERRGELPAGAVERVEAAAAGVEETLRRLVEQEKNSSALAEQERVRRHPEMKQGATAKRALGAYVVRPAAPGDPRFVDKTQ